MNCARLPANTDASICGNAPLLLFLIILSKYKSYNQNYPKLEILRLTVASSIPRSYNTHIVIT